MHNVHVQLMEKSISSTNLYIYIYIYQGAKWGAGIVYYDFLDIFITLPKNTINGINSDEFRNSFSD